LEETSTVDTAVSDAPAEVEAPSEAIGGEAINAKLDSMNDEQSDSDVNADSDGEASQDSDAKADESDSKAESETELQKFIASKGVDLKNIDENTQKAYEMAMNSEQRMNQAIQEQADANNRVEEKQLDKAASDVVEKTEDAPVELSPLKTVDANFSDTSESILALAGVNSMDELMTENPTMYQNLMDAYSEAKEEAMTQEVEWHINKKDADQAKADNETTVNKEYEKLKEVSVSRLEKAEKENPEIVADFEKYGTDKALIALQDITGVPLEYFTANEEFFDFFKGATAAMKAVADLPGRDDKIKDNVEKQISKTKKAEMVSSASPLPDDHTAAFKMNMAGKSGGVSMKD
jgi:hypothetical protein